MDIARPLFAAVAPAGLRARLSILIFHRVLARPDPLLPDEFDAARFDRVCGWLRRWFDVLPLSDAARLLREGRLPGRALSITFDDGYADNHDVALPILRRHGLPATFFVATGFLDGGRMWNDSIIEAIRRTSHDAVDLYGIAGLSGRLPLGELGDRRAAIGRIVDALKYQPLQDRLEAVDALTRRLGAALPDDLMMTGPQLRRLHADGMAIGGHTVRHPILARVGLDEARAEIAEGRRALEAIVDAPVELFAYPNGRPGRDFASQHVQLVREAGFTAAVTTGWGAADARTDPYQLPRFTPWDRDRLRFGLRLWRNLAVARRPVLHPA